MVTLDYQVLKSAKGSIHMGGYRILLLYPNLQITDAPCYLVCLNDLRLGREAAPLQGGRELCWGQFWRLRWGWKEVARFFSAVRFHITWLVHSTAPSIAWNAIYGGSRGYAFFISVGFLPVHNLLHLVQATKTRKWS